MTVTGKKSEEVTYVNIDKIKIPKLFLENTPSQSKLDKKRRQLDSGKFKPIRINSDMKLKDGYAIYLVMKERGFRQVPVVEVDSNGCIPKYKRDKTTYIVGHHPYNHNKYVWRVSNRTKCAHNLDVGKKAVVKTSGGARLVLIDKVYTSDKPDTDRPIKEVIVCLKD